MKRLLSYMKNLDAVFRRVKEYFKLTVKITSGGKYDASQGLRTRNRTLKNLDAVFGCVTEYFKLAVKIPSGGKYDASQELRTRNRIL